MGYIGTKPSAVPLTSADITDGIITSAKIADGTIVNADINASAAIASTKLSGVTSDFVLIKTQTISTSVSSVEFINGTNSVVFDGTYSTYKIICKNIVNSTTGQTLKLEITTDSGSTYKTSGYRVVTHRAYYDGSTTGNDVITYTDRFAGSAVDISADSLGGMLWEVTLSKPTLTTKPYANSFVSGFDSNAGYIIISKVAGVYNTAGAYNGFRLISTSGNLTAGEISLYGIKG